MLTVKSKNGVIEFVFSQNIGVDQAIDCIKKEKDEHSGFFNTENIVLAYSGIELDYFEEVAFVKGIKKIFGKNCKIKKKHVLSATEIKHSFCEGENFSKTYAKSLRSGERLESRGDVTVIGDVNPGATVCAKGNIVVLGALRGTVQTVKGSIVYASYMEPMQIKIGKVISYSKTKKCVENAVAKEENGEIFLETL